MPHPPLPGEQPPGEPAEELLAILAHELRRPLTALRGALMTLQHRTQTLSGSQQQELLGMANRQGEQLQRLLDQLLTAASTDHMPAPSGRRSLVDVAALAEEAAHAARIAHPNHPITIEAAGPLPVRVDPLAISRILGNLLDNAAAYSPPGAAIELSASRDGVQALLAVQDQGPGIPHDQRDRIFQRYARLGTPTANPGGSGLGLGLYIARRLATANCGRLQVTNPPDHRGARFELRLPLAPSTPLIGDPDR
jgi:two-component system OmpR family sensor kinase